MLYGMRRKERLDGVASKYVRLHAWGTVCWGEGGNDCDGLGAGG